jgi:hypothetical protein
MCSLKQPFVKFFPHFKLLNVAYYQIQIQLSGFSPYADGPPSLLIRISGVTPSVHITYNQVISFDPGRRNSTLQTKYFEKRVRKAIIEVS